MGGDTSADGDHLLEAEAVLAGLEAGELRGEDAPFLGLIDDQHRSRRRGIGDQFILSGIPLGIALEGTSHHEHEGIAIFPGGSSPKRNRWYLLCLLLFFQSCLNQPSRA